MDGEGSKARRRKERRQTDFIEGGESRWRRRPGRMKGRDESVLPFIARLSRGLDYCLR